MNKFIDNKHFMIFCFMLNQTTFKRKFLLMDYNTCGTYGSLLFQINYERQG